MVNRQWCAFCGEACGEGEPWGLWYCPHCGVDFKIIWAKRRKTKAEVERHG